jgi:hypothetical protein
LVGSRTDYDPSSAPLVLFCNLLLNQRFLQNAEGLVAKNPLQETDYTVTRKDSSYICGMPVNVWD